MAGFDAPGAGPGGLDPSRPPAAYTPVYAFHEPFAWSTARLLQARRAWSRATCARSHAGSSHAGRAGVFVPQDRQRRRARLQAPDALFPDTQVGALVGAWVVGSLALVLLIRLFLRAVCPHVEPLPLPWGTSCPPAQPIPLSLCLPHSVPAADTRASPRRCPPASRSGRCCLQPARTSGARTQGLGVLEPKSCQAAHSPLAPPLLLHRVAHSVWQRQTQTCCVCHEVLVGTEVPVQVCCCCACWACTSGPRADGTAITPRRARCAAWRPTRSACTS